MLNFICDHDVLTSLQSGFIPGDSTVNQLEDTVFIIPSVKLNLKSKKSMLFSGI